MLTDIRSARFHFFMYHPTTYVSYVTPSFLCSGADRDCLKLIIESLKYFSLLFSARRLTSFVQTALAYIIAALQSFPPALTSASDEQSFHFSSNEVKVYINYAAVLLSLTTSSCPRISHLEEHRESACKHATGRCTSDSGNDIHTQLYV